MKINLFLSILLHFLSYNCHASRILLIGPLGTKSHHMFYRGVAEALATKSHQVTVITLFDLYKNIPNIQQILVPNDDFLDLTNNNQMFKMSVLDFIKIFLFEMPEICIKSTRYPQVQKVLNKEYDLVLLPYLMSRCYLPYVHNKKVPFAFLYPNTKHSSLINVVGDLELTSIVPPIFYYMPHPMTFIHRAMSACLSIYEILFDIYFTTWWVERRSLQANVFGYTIDSPSLRQIEKQTSLVIINGIKSLELPARPHSPNIVHAGGIHIQENNGAKLPLDIKKWLDESGPQGAILFSLGSVLKPSQMKPENLRMFLKVFKSLKQRVIWKWDESDLRDMPSNVKISKWIPQQEVLAHKNLKLFISHGGLLSTLEALFFNVPLVGLPVYGDQFHNIDRAVAEGYALKLSWDNISEVELKSAILAALHNTSIRETMSQKSLLMRDSPLTPAQSVVYWIEYVIRHKGANHLRPPLADMSWYQIYNVDVWLFVIAVNVLLTSLMAGSCYFCCFSKRNRRNRLKNKKE